MTILAAPLAAPALGRNAPAWVRHWLWVLVVLVIAMVMVGGATRLTGSGLSITEWKPIAGMVPPLSNADWQAEFAHYRASPQYDLVNAGMTLPAFKTIFWWEWSHRQLGRFIGLVYLAGFVLALWRRAIVGAAAARLAAIGVLLGLQGIAGWIMVASGLAPGMTAVEPTALALHLVLATVLLATLVAEASAPQRRSAAVAPSRVGALLPKLLVGFVILQIALGALVAGSHAGLVYNSWPLMGEHLVPPTAELFAATPWWANFIGNATLIQLDHRLGAYGLVLLALAQALWFTTPEAARPARLTAALVLAQAVLGIATLVLAVPLWAALAHQLLAMLVLVAATRTAVSAGRSGTKRAFFPFSRAQRDVFPSLRAKRSNPVL